MRWSVPRSIPLARERTGTFGRVIPSCFHPLRLSRSRWVGSASTTPSTPSSASATFAVAVTEAGSTTSPRYSGFRWSSRIARAVSSRRAHTATSHPASPRTREKVLPQLPASSIAMRVMLAPPDPSLAPRFGGLADREPGRGKKAPLPNSNPSVNSWGTPPALRGAGLWLPHMAGELSSPCRRRADEQGVHRDPPCRSCRAQTPL